MKIACKRIFEAIEKKERIIVFGDFDSDGITSTAILTKAIADLGGIVSYRIPDRTTDNHGLKNYLLDEIAQKNTKLVITCDCGINDFEQVAHAKKIGLDIIITDHHTPKKEKFPKDNFSLIMGSDNLENLHKWKNADILFKEYPFYVYNRPGHTDTKNAEKANVSFLDAPQLKISSTFIRKSLKEGKSVKYILHDKVLEEIERTGWYQ